MVREGDLIIELVEANTKTPFKEHLKDGKVYVETEPDIDYFIHLRNSWRPDQIHEVLLLYPSVDGHSLGYHIPVHSDKVHDVFLGLWKRENGMVTHTALRFNKVVFGARVGRVEENKDAGKIEFEVHVGHSPSTHVAADCKDLSGLSCPNLVQRGSKNLDKKLCSSEGTASIVSTIGNAAVYTRYKKGELLYTIKLQYCSAVGLIDAGVLPKLDDKYADFLLRNPKRRATPTSNPHTTDVTSKIEVKMETSANGNLLKREYEVLDMIAALDAEEAREDAAEGAADDSPENDK